MTFHRGRAVVAGAVGLLAAGALAAVPPAAGADEPWAGVTWSAPAVVSPAGVDVDRGGVWQLDDGSQLALWSVYDHPSQVGDGPAQVWTSTRPTSSGSWAEPVQVSDYQQYFTTYPNFAWTADPSGAAVVAWTQYDPVAQKWTVRATTRSAAGTWSSPATVGSEAGAVGSLSSGDTKAVAVAADGRATVVFTAREAVKAPGENSFDGEVFRTAWSGAAWSVPEEVSVETPSVPIVCNEPDPGDCPDREGPSGQPMAAYDGAGQEWIAWVHVEAADEPAEEAGIFLRGATTTQLATGSEAQGRTFGLAAIAADGASDAGGVALAWRREVEGVVGGETWAHAGGDVTGATSLVTPAARDGAVRSLAMDDGRAVVVVGVPPSGIDGSRQLVTALRGPGAGVWGPATDVVEDGDGVVGTSGRALLTPSGLPVVGFVSATGDQARALAPAGTGWEAASISGTLDVTGSGTVLHSFASTPAGTLLASWLSEDGGVDRLHVSASTGLPAGTPAQPPATPTMTAPGTASMTTAGSHTVRWSAVPGASYDVRWRRAMWNGGFGGLTQPAGWQGIAALSVTHALPRGSTTCYAVRARSAGGTSAWTSERCVVAPLDQVSMARSTGWTVRNGSAYLGGSAWQATSRGRSLTRTGASLRRAGLVATTCPSCGAVDVYVGTRRIGRLSLARGATTRNRQVLLLPAFTERTGKVRVVVVTSNRLVRVDGLVVAAR